MKGYILKDRKPVRELDVNVFFEWLKDSDQDRLVAKDQLGDVVVSTTFLGFDQSFRGGEPILFETLISGGEFDGSEIRYRTWEEAEAGHKKVLAHVRAALTN